MEARDRVEAARVEVADQAAVPDRVVGVRVQAEARALEETRT